MDDNLMASSAPSAPPQAAGQESLARRGDVMMLFVATIIELGAAGKLCNELNNCENQYGWAVACGSISLVMCLLLFLVGYIGKGSAGVTKFFAVFLGALWTAGTLVLTFDLPFTGTGNGYFSTWIAFASAMVFLSDAMGGGHMDSMKNFVFNEPNSERKAAICIFLGSVFELIAAIVVCSEHSNCTEDNAWAVACGVISSVLSLLIMFKPGLLPANIMSLFFCVWWTCGVGWLTFEGPFQFTGNGYFSTWIAMFASAYYFFVAWIAGIGQTSAPAPAAASYEGFQDPA